jgi:ribosomal protein S18 acetylase RimI-like enzyme
MSNTFETFRRELARAALRGVAIAPALPEEVSALVELVRQPKLERGQQLPPAAASQDQLRRALAQPEHVVLALRSADAAGSAPMGLLWCHRRARRAGWDCYVDEIALAPGWRQRGLGTALLQNVAELARSAGASRWGLDQMVDNAAVGRLYGRLGLKVVGHDLRAEALFGWPSEPSAPIEVRAGSELDLQATARWLSRIGALDSLDQPELEPEAIEASLRHSLERDSGQLWLAFHGGEPSAVSWCEPRTSKAGQPILVFRALAVHAGAGAPMQAEASERRDLLALCARGPSLQTASAAYATVWGSPESATFHVLSELGFRVGRLKWQREL